MILNVGFGIVKTKGGFKIDDVKSDHHRRDYSGLEIQNRLLGYINFSAMKFVCGPAHGWEAAEIIRHDSHELAILDKVYFPYNRMANRSFAKRWVAQLRNGTMAKLRKEIQEFNKPARLKHIEAPKPKLIQANYKDPTVRNPEAECQLDASLSALVAYGSVSVKYMFETLRYGKIEEEILGKDKQKASKSFGNNETDPDPTCQIFSLDMSEPSEPLEPKSVPFLADDDVGDRLIDGVEVSDQVMTMNEDEDTRRWIPDNPDDLGDQDQTETDIVMEIDSDVDDSRPKEECYEMNSSDSEEEEPASHDDDKLISLNDKSAQHEQAFEQRTPKITPATSLLFKPHTPDVKLDERTEETRRLRGLDLMRISRLKSSSRLFRPISSAKPEPSKAVENKIVVKPPKDKENIGVDKSQKQKAQSKNKNRNKRHKPHKHAAKCRV
jgi:hypothetical protein